jgi:GTP-dependent phosphoenolpyruvate carboxykinase
MERKSYRSASNTPEKKPYQKPQPQQRENKFIYITGFFPSKSGKADTVFINEDILAKLQVLKIGDLLSLSEQKNGNIGMSYIPAEENGS